MQHIIISNANFAPYCLAIELKFYRNQTHGFSVISKINLYITPTFLFRAH